MKKHHNSAVTMLKEGVLSGFRLVKHNLINCLLNQDEGNEDFFFNFRIDVDS